MAELLPLGRLHPHVGRYAESTAARRQTWLIAVSGGSDSVALVLLVWALWPEQRRRMVVVHFNHRLRGRDAADDARFCARLGKSLGIRHVAEAWRDPPAAASEAEARAARHAFFAAVARRFRTRVLWLGHQQDDIAESMLMRLARGSGTAGLAAPRPVQRFADDRVHLRPLLTLGKREVEQALLAIGATWREDRTNRTSVYFRNRLRADVVPAWVLAAGRDAVAGAALARERLEEDDAALEVWLDALAPLSTPEVLDLRVLQDKPVALYRRALHRWLLALKAPVDLSRHGFDDLLSKVIAGRPTRFSLGASGFARIRRGQLRHETL